MVLATGEYRNEIQEDLNAIVGFDEKLIMQLLDAP